MAAFKNKDNGTWYVQFRYTDWKGERQQKLKRGFATKRQALEWERSFLMEKQADDNMTFESFYQECAFQCSSGRENNNHKNSQRTWQTSSMG